jgi:hypothetical protein
LAPNVSCIKKIEDKRLSLRLSTEASGEGDVAISGVNKQAEIIEGEVVRVMMSEA